MIFLHFSSPAILSPLQHNMAEPHFSGKSIMSAILWKLQMAFVHALSLHKFLRVRSLLFIASRGPRVFSKEESVEGSCRGA